MARAPESAPAQPVPKAAAGGKAQGRERLWIHPWTQGAKRGKPGDLNGPRPCPHLPHPANTPTAPGHRQSAAHVPGRVTPSLFLTGQTERRR